MNNFDKWLKSEIAQELKTVPKSIREHAKTNKNTFEIVLSSVCRKLCLNSQATNVNRLFKEAL